jgi:hypothetical protein
MSDFASSMIQFSFLRWCCLALVFLLHSNGMITGWLEKTAFVKDDL